MPAVFAWKRGFERGHVVGGNEARARHQRFKILPVLGLAGDGERAEAAPVEGIVERDDLVFGRVQGAAVRVDHLERALHGLGAGVGEEAALQAAHFREAFGQEALVAVVVEVGRVDQQAGLFADNLHQPRMGVAQGVDPDTGDKVEITLPGEVVEVGAFAARQHQGITGIILEKVFLFQVHDGLGRVIGQWRCACHLLMIAGKTRDLDRVASPGRALRIFHRVFPRDCGFAI